MSGGAFDQTVCDSAELAEAGAEGFYCYTRRENVGLLAVSFVGFMSLVAVASMLARIVMNKWESLKKPKAERTRKLVEEPMDVFVLSLFCADLLQSLGVVMDVRWINDGIVRVGSLCTAQGVLQNTGQAAIAITTFIITLHTFDSLWRAGGVRSRSTAYAIVGTVWTFLLLTVAISAGVHRSPSFYAPTPYWCWINSAYPNYRIAIENFWLWIGLAVATLYIPLLFWSAGLIAPGERLIEPVEKKWWAFRLTLGDEKAPKSGASTKLILCALTYCLPVLPTSLARWFLVVHGDVKPFATAEAQYIVKGIFSLSGLCDVIVFRYARPGLLLFPKKKESGEGNATAVELDTLEVEAKASADPNGVSASASSVSFARENAPSPSQNSQENGSKPWRPIAFIFSWFAFNGLYAVMVTYYIRAATNPNPRNGVNRGHAGWQAYYLCMYVIGFFLGCFNIAAWMLILQSPENNLPPAWKFKFTPPRPLSVLVRWAICVPLAVIMAFGPFFAPVAGVRVAQEQAWLHRCDSFSMEVLLEGVPFNAPQSLFPTATLYSRPYGSLLEASQYNLTSNNASSAQLTMAFGYDIETIEYNFDLSTFQATCTNGSQCGSGTFQDTGRLSFSVNDGSSETNLSAVDKSWDYKKNDDAPSYILKDVATGAMVLRTAVTQPGHCRVLKVCAESAGLETLAPIGLTLLKQNEYSRVCTTPNSN